MNELFDQMKTLWAAVEANYNTYNEKGTKKCLAQSRKSAMELRKIIGPFKKATIDEVKK